ncbi:dipeptidase [Methylovirgula sp. 4M-Z18]|uniref:dipeptidase n=1 Tax=Methylovirgula sp. 4M-Z18 TaxID=2293567 RepID=UPI000E2ECAE9|nr:dipeptidase [Methylovirgula sp. 4M-Z18]RFB80829.1 membrane dipeptidase [Methylovirgula sp. 4M-Z18]
MAKIGARQALAHAKELLDTVPLVDGHNDLPYSIRLDPDAKGDVRTYRLDRKRAGRDTDIPRLTAGQVGAQFWAAYVPYDEGMPASYALQQIALVRAMNALHDDVFLAATKASDIARAKRQNRIASFVTIENGAALEGRLDTLQAFYDLGVRLITLCHNHTTDWCDSATDAPRHNGLSDFGKRVIGEMNRLGMIIDLAHVSDAVMHQVLDLSKAPVVWSHSNARHLCNHRRNVPEDVLDRVAPNGGIVMATFVPDFISQRSFDWSKPLRDEYGAARHDLEADAFAKREQKLGAWPRGNLSEYCDHLDYLSERIGFDHIGIGSDFFGGPQGEGLKDASCFPHIFAELIRRGWSDANLKKLASGNFLRVFRAVEEARSAG